MAVRFEWVSAMDDKTKSRLAAVLSKESERRKAVAEANAKREAAKQALEERKRLALEQWVRVRADIESVVNDVNEQIRPSGLMLTISEEEKPAPAITRTYIKLQSSSKDGSMIVLNVNAYGHVQPVFLIPHTGKAPADLELIDTNADTWPTMIVDFIDQVLAYADSQTKSALTAAAAP